MCKHPVDGIPMTKISECCFSCAHAAHIPHTMPHNQSPILKPDSSITLVYVHYNIMYLHTHYTQIGITLLLLLVFVVLPAFPFSNPNSIQYLLSSNVLLVCTFAEWKECRSAVSRSHYVSVFVRSRSHVHCTNIAHSNLMAHRVTFHSMLKPMHRGYTHIASMRANNE